MSARRNIKKGEMVYFHYKNTEVEVMATSDASGQLPDEESGIPGWGVVWSFEAVDDRGDAHTIVWQSGIGWSF